MILRLEKDTFKIRFANVRDVSENYTKKGETKFFLFTLEMALTTVFSA